MSELPAYLDLPLGCVDQALINDAARRGLYKRVRHLPHTLSYGQTFFECRLGGTAERVDVSFGLSAAAGNRDTILCLEEAGTSPGHDRWHTAQAYLRGVAAASPGLWDAISKCGLEFDATGGSPGFFCVPRRVAKSLSSPLSTTVFGIMDGLAGGKADRGVKRNLEAIFSKLGPDVPLGFMGWMFGRTGRAVRVCLVSTGVREALDLLGRLNLDETARQSCAVLGPYRELASLVVVALDVGEDISSRVGFEICGFGLARQPKEPGARMLDILEQQGLCTPEQARALRRYPGSEAIQQRLEAWASSLQNAYIGTFLSQHLLCVRRINHIKLTLGLEGEPTAKVYLSALYVWRENQNGRVRRLTDSGVPGVFNDEVAA